MATTEEFLQEQGTIIDVRSPGEYTQGHIPGAINLPLLDNEERAMVGTLYKQSSPEDAFDEGLRLVSPKLPLLVQSARQIGTPHLRIHCWRGGMRSSFVAQLLQYAGFKCITLQGGYQAFRRWTLNSFSIPKECLIVGGMTGNGKTAILHELKRQGEQVLDLEKLANHCGSTFGYFGKQPTNEQLENEIAIQWHSFSDEKPLWIEDESRQIGSCTIPHALYQQMAAAPVFVIKRPYQERMERLLREYGDVPKESLIESTQRIHKRLGGERTKEIITNLESGKMREAFTLLLQYYDKAYCYALKKRSNAVCVLEDSGLNEEQWAQLLCLKKMIPLSKSC